MNNFIIRKNNKITRINNNYSLSLANLLQPVINFYKGYIIIILDFLYALNFLELLAQ